jgi:transcriptional regulator NrdR family protein
MKCPDCSEDTSVLDSRLTPAGYVRRRRVCPAGHRVTTYETTTPPERPKAQGRKRRPLSPQQRDVLRAITAARTAEQRRAANKRKHLRRAAREEARRTGEDVKLIYARWGCE